MEVTVVGVKGHSNGTCNECGYISKRSACNKHVVDVPAAAVYGRSPFREKDNFTKIDIPSGTSSLKNLTTK